MSFQDPAIMSVRLSNPPDSPYRTPSTSVVPQPHQQLPTIGGHRLSVFERVTRTGDEPQLGTGFGVGLGLGNVDAGGFSSMLSGRGY